MIRSLAVCAAVISGFACIPATAADLPLRPHFFRSPVSWASSPFYVVNPGPVISGPDIVITKIRYTNTDVRLSYPYIGPIDYPTRPVRRRW